MKPTLLLVHGLPASGKTTLAMWLAQHLRWPAIYKDEIKEIMFDHIGYKDRAWSPARWRCGWGSEQILIHWAIESLRDCVAHIPMAQ